MQKVRAIAARHTRVFAALCEFLALGHRLVIVRGNHDIELHWRAAQRSAVVDAISAHAACRSAREVAARIRISHSVLRGRRLLYVEHGHEFDATRSYGDPLLPTCPRDSRRIRLEPVRSDAAPRGAPDPRTQHAPLRERDFRHLLRLLLRLGISGSVGIALRFTGVVTALLGECFASLRREHALRDARCRQAPTLRQPDGDQPGHAAPAGAPVRAPCSLQLFAWSRVCCT